jgi:4-diphosphocytidyl-2-C-methyl-D-erythritol kinase
MADIVETAWAKINLALHVTGQRTDGYHLLESLVTFAEVGDRLSFQHSIDDRFTISGPFAGDLTPTFDNMVLRARDALRDAAIASGFEAPPVAIHLEKHLPVASGIGGGSADAAACMRGLLRCWNVPAAELDLDAIAAGLGADVSMCLVSRPLFAAGIGEKTKRIEAMPAMEIVLVNPRVAISTPEVFGRLQNKNNPAMAIPRAGVTEDLAMALGELRNDLEAPATALAPIIAKATDALSHTDALLVRMSGSGATIFGLFGNVQRAESAAKSIRAAYPAWYVCASTTLPG